MRPVHGTPASPASTVRALGEISRSPQRTIQSDSDTTTNKGASFKQDRRVLHTNTHSRSAGKRYAHTTYNSAGFNPLFSFPTHSRNGDDDSCCSYRSPLCTEGLICVRVCVPDPFRCVCLALNAALPLCRKLYAIRSTPYQNTILITYRRKNVLFLVVWWRSGIYF